jgi:hypothetical protein
VDEYILAVLCGDEGLAVVMDMLQLVRKPRGIIEISQLSGTKLLGLVVENRDGFA